MSSNAYKDFNIGTFIAWGLMLKEKWELLALDIDSYNIDVWCHQENKIKGFDINIGVRPHKLTDLETDSIITTVFSSIANGIIISISIGQTTIVYSIHTVHQN